MVGSLLLMKLHLKHRRSRKSNGNGDKGGAPIKKEHSDLEENLCRICLKVGDIPIFGDNTMATMHEDIHSVTDVEVSSVDNFPKHICIQCLSDLESAIRFRKTAQISDRKLKKTKEEFDHQEPKEVPDTPSEQIIMTLTKMDRSLSSQCSDDLPVHQEDSDAECKEEIMSDSENKTYHCHLCSINFDSVEELTTHKKSDDHRKVKQKCPICNKSYHMPYFTRHVAYHNTGTPYHVCHVCGKGFVIKTHFTRHVATHGDALPHQCELCPYRGRWPESLKLHMRKHTGEKPYQCNECPVQCLTKSNLNRHMRTHKKEHDFHCDMCSKGFYSSRELTLHIKVDHSGIKDYVCNICNKAFGYRKQMMKHQLKVHKREKKTNGRVPLYLQLEQKNLLEQSG